MIRFSLIMMSLFLVCCNSENINVGEKYFSPNFGCTIKELEKEGFTWPGGIDVVFYEKQIDSVVSEVYFFDDDLKVTSQKWSVLWGGSPQELRYFLLEHKLTPVPGDSIQFDRPFNLIHLNNQLVYFCSVEKSKLNNKLRIDIFLNRPKLSAE